MSHSIQERLAADLQKAKTEGSTRANRIGAIVREAATQAVTEVKAGSGELGAIAKESLATVASNLGEPEAEVISDVPPQATSWKTLLMKLFQGLKVRFGRQVQKEYSEAKVQMGQLKDRALQVDTRLTERYGDRYTTVKQRLEDTRVQASTWYANTRTQAEEQGIDPVQQQQVQADARVAEAGSFVAQKEQQLRQQVKTLLQRSATNQ